MKIRLFQFLQLTQILDKMLAEKPKERYQSAQEILAQLQTPPLTNPTHSNLPLKKVQINIDQAKRERQVAEILESDEFKLLEEQVSNLRQSTKTATSSSVLDKTPESEVEPTPVDSQFLDYCQQELTRCVGPMGNFLLEDIFGQSPQLTPQQLVEALAAEIPDPQRSQVFRTRLADFLPS